MNLSLLFKRILLLTVIFILSVTAVACTETKVPADTTATETTAPDTTVEDTTEADKEPEEITYTLPLSSTKDGRLLKEYSYSKSGLTMTLTDFTEETPITYTVTFAEDGRPVSCEWVVAVNNIRTERWKDEYTLDDKGNIVTEKRYCEGALQFTYTYTYDENGNMLTQRSQQEYNKKNFTDYILTYDSHNTCVAVTSSLNGAPAEAYKEDVENVYGEDGRIVESRSDSYTVTYEYTDKDGFLTNEKVSYKSTDYSWSYYYQYTYENGKLIKEDCSYNGILTGTTLYTQSTCAHYADAIDWIFRERLP